MGKNLVSFLLHLNIIITIVMMKIPMRKGNGITVSFDDSSTTHAVPDATNRSGHEEIHDPECRRRPDAQLVQVSEPPLQVAQLDAQAVHLSTLA